MNINPESVLTDDVNIEQLELEGFKRSIAEIEWLLLFLVLIYYISHSVDFRYPFGAFLSIAAFTGFIFSFHYINFFTIPAQWKLAVETWIMILFVSWVIINSEGANSPLFNLYILIIIASALSLGKFITFLEFTLIACVYVYICYPVYAQHGFTMNDFIHFMTLFCPILLITYVTVMLSSDVQHGKKALRLLSETDDMTGLRNTRSFRSTMRTEINTSERYSRRFSVMMIDSDNLKDINDSYGHKTGDMFIKHIATLIQDNLRASDVIARFGGDEFVVLMPETDTQTAKEVAEKIRQIIENSAFNVNGSVITHTVSIGVAGFPLDSTNLEVLLDCADKALYESKKSGRNTVCSYTDTKPATSY